MRRAAVLLLLFLLAELCCCVVFDSNDDAAMMFIAAGFFTGKGQETLIYSSVWIGHLLKYLYAQFPAWNWYVIFHATVLYGAALSLLFSLKKRTDGDKVRTGFLILLFLPALLAPQYSITAFACALASWLLLWRGYKFGYFLAFLLLQYLAISIRWHAALTLMAFNLLFAIIFWRHKTEYGALWKRQLPGLCASAFVLLAHFFFEKDYYTRHYQYPEVFSYQSALDKGVNGPGKIDETRLKTLGWQEAELNVLRSWCLFDSTIYSVKNIVYLGKGVSGLRSLRAAVGEAKALFLADGPYILAICLLVLMQYRRNIKQRRFVLLVLTGGIAFCIYAVFCFRLPHRLFYPLSLCLFLTLMFFDETSEGKPLSRPVVPFVTGVLLLFQGALMQLRNHRVHRKAEAAFTWMAAQPDKNFIIRGSAVPYEGFRTWRNPVQKSAFNLIPSGWIINTPAYEEILKKHGYVQRFTSLMSDSNAIFIALPYDDIAQILRTHYNTDWKTEALEKALHGDALLGQTPRENSSPF